MFTHEHRMVGWRKRWERGDTEAIEELFDYADSLGKRHKITIDCGDCDDEPIKKELKK